MNHKPILLLGILIFSSFCFAQHDSKELHVVSFYEGREKTDGQIHGPRADIAIDRPDKDEALLMSIQLYILINRVKYT